MAIVRRGNQKVRSITGTGMSRVRRSVLRAYDQYLVLTICLQWLKWFCEAWGGSPDEARLEQTPYPFQPH